MYSKKLLSVSLHRLYGMDMRSHNSGNFRVKICIFERSNEKNYFSKTKIIFYKKTTPQLLEHIGLQNMKVGVKTNLGDLPLFV